MKVKLTLDEPVIVSLGPTVEEASWGTHQFPAINTDDTGNIGVTFHGAKDLIEAYGTEPCLYISKDKGKTWEEVDSKDVHNTKTRFGIKLPNKDRYTMETRTPVKVDTSKLPEPMPFQHDTIKLYPAEGVSDEMLDKRWRYLVLSEGQDVPEYKYFDYDKKGLCITSSYDALVPPFPFGRIRIDHENTVWQTTYRRSRNPDNLGFSPYYNTHYYTFSQDYNYLYQASWIPYIPDTRIFKNSFVTEGFAESDIAFLPDGSCITLMRTGSDTPSFLARSTDKGRTWSKPVVFDDKGVWPCLCVLPCNVTLASYGRPGFYIRATADPTGLSWDAPVELITSNDRTCERNTPISIYNQTSRRGTCSYSDMIALNENTAMVVYSDFFVPDEFGIKRKAILTRKIHVDI
ncbi:MAG: sialidase family protein [Clostridia bacterium]|nr:sialidase family protein [Clostridia bacterium]